MRLADTAALAIEIAELRRLDDLPFTPISRRYFRKQVAIASALYVLALAALLLTPMPSAVSVPLVAAMWVLQVAVIHLRWTRGGLAIHDGMVVARSGALGVDYHVFPRLQAPAGEPRANGVHAPGRREHPAVSHRVEHHPGALPEHTVRPERRELLRTRGRVERQVLDVRSAFCRLNEDLLT